MNGILNVFEVFSALMAEKFRPNYDARLQLLTYQVKMLRSRIDDSKIYTTGVHEPVILPYFLRKLSAPFIDTFYRVTRSSRTSFS